MTLLTSALIAAPPVSPDTSFNAALDANASVLTMDFQTDDRLVGGGRFTSVGSPAIQNLARFNRDGTIDPTFRIGTGPDGTVDLIKVQPDNKILLAGSFTKFDGQPVKPVCRLNADGTLDPTFSPSIVLSAIQETMALQNDGKILVLAPTSTGVARLNSDGSLDPAWQTKPNGLIRQILAQEDGKVLIAGRFSSINDRPAFTFAKLNSNGSLDPVFDAGRGAEASDLLGPWVGAMRLQEDGKIVIGGHFTRCNGIPRQNIARLNSDGTVDTNFVAAVSSNTSLISPQVNSLTLLPDGKVGVAGWFTHMNGVEVNGAERGGARLNRDGTIDDTFKTIPGAIVFAVDAAGATHVGGKFSQVNGVTRYGIVRFLPESGGLPRLLRPTLEGTNLVFFAFVPAGQSYRIEFKGALSDANWTHATAGKGGVAPQRIELPIGSPRRFYRLVAQ